MKTTLIAYTIAAILLGGCTSVRVPGSPLAAGSHGITTKSGTEQAHRDIASGQLRLLEAGTRGVCAPGVPDNDKRFAKLPRHRLPCGCTTPNANLWVRYAEAYNLVVVAYVRDQATR